MKICTYCNSQYDDSEVVCRKCGNNLADAGVNQGYAPTGYNQAPQNPQPQYQPQPQPYQQAPQQPYQAPVTPPAKKGGIQWWHILLIVLAVLIIGGLIAGIVAVSVFGNKIDAPVEDVYEEVEDEDEDEEEVTEDVAADEDEEPVEVPTTAAPVEYTVGESVNGVYTNEWADLRIDFSGWTEGSAEDYSVYTADGKTDCWLVAMDFDSMTQVVLLAEPLYGITAAYTEADYQEIVISQLTAVFDSYGYDYEVGYYTEADVAGKMYECALIDIATTNVYMEYKTTKIDNYMVTFLISNSKGEDPSLYMPDIFEY